jgi:hypothetical protein
MRLRSSTLETTEVVKIYKRSGKNILGLGKDGVRHLKFSLEELEMGCNGYTIPLLDSFFPNQSK